MTPPFYQDSAESTEDGTNPAIAVPLSEIQDTRYLELVNRQYPISAFPDDGLLTEAVIMVPVGSQRDMLLHETALSAISEMFDAFRKEDMGTFSLVSGFRDRETQQQIYDSTEDKSLAQPPDYSEHHLGLAVDIQALGVDTANLGASPEGRWLTENSWRFGLVLRYPENKQSVTGISYEPWHFRYVGQPHAWYMRENAMVLEEYIEFLRENGSYTASYDGKEYTVMYQTPADGALRVPDSSNFTISGDNTGGYVITSENAR
jgi:D-alanyl-D-alanine carboxypeptidase